MADEADLRELETRLISGDQAALPVLLEQYRSRLRRMVELRMHPRLRGRVDPSDVIQDACLQAAGRIDGYVQDRPMPFFIWLRFLVGEQLIALQRHHLGTAKRDASREVPLHALVPEASSAMVAAHLVGSFATPLQHVLRAERQRRLQLALDQLEPIDREIIVLRNIEQLTRAEAADVLGIRVATAGKRYVRAMDRLRSLLGESSSSWVGL